MSVSIQTLYTECCTILQEDGGLTLGIVTLQQFLDILGVVILDFCQRAALVKNIFTTPIQAGVALYQVPDDVIKPEMCFVAGKLKEKVTEAELTQGHFSWRKESGWTKQWHEDNLAPKFLELYPKPNWNGVPYGGSNVPVGEYSVFNPADNNLTMVGPAAPDITAWTLLDSNSNPVLLQCVPDSFSPYILYGVLEHIFSGDNELRDIQRASYCRTRFAEATLLADAIGTEELLDSED